MIVRFELAGKRKNNEEVFLMPMHRKYKIERTIWHKNDYHTVLEIPKEVYKKNFKYNPSTGLYENLTGITWKEMKERGFVTIYSCKEGGYPIQQVYP